MRKENIKYNKQKTVIQLLSYAVILLCFGCTSGEMPTDEKPAEVTTLQIPITRSGTENEDQIGNCRMIIFSKAGRVLYNQKHNEADGLTFTAEVPVGKIDLYLVANEQAAWNLDNVSSPGDLKGKQLAFSAYPLVDATHPIPMFGSYENIKAEPNDATVLSSAAIERLYSKVTLDLSCAFEDIADTEIVLEHVAVNSMPSWSKLSPASYSGTVFNGAQIAPATLGTNYNATQSRDKKAGFSATYTFYVPEYLVSNKADRSYLAISVYQKDDITNKKTYKVILGDGIADTQPGHNDNTYMGGESATLTDLRISRNRHYTFTASIKNFDASSDETDVNVEGQVIDWEDGGTVEVPLW
ncbi:hypothetical protein M2459_003122 [Parabacteroides sp. PF5-5]|uniref:hypothetical protein n=1 Tax=unclassified Parabacteroides TaxID=2649774 RepID=UPI002476FA4A|nr:MULTISPECIES: hypothetical protein [unclassified Parabacteroides]MDH6307065.1 hypothetical protein [Parabacteroides sp. PH5-39]MDH6317275.1 hypothetical protein [Parabacteroides sp. PF5-13]MDH6321721.1 hypothetical protein [Parabacteroides sp. PH5-13]MDH6325453.1 hypothetical protein [Parabacteroides sp. PH5-8]MDH6328551.1 hypothetical protein [Parabacteroides sp. PH5-41]